MKTTMIAFLGILTMLSFTACHDNETLEEINLQGNYSGIFTVEYTNGTIRTNPVTINFTQNTYTCSSGSNYTPAGGNGTFQVERSTVSFKDENFWTANFDWNLILSGEYNLAIDNGTIEISSMRNSGFYQYKIEKTGS